MLHWFVVMIPDKELTINNVSEFKDKDVLYNKRLKTAGHVSPFYLNFSQNNVFLHFSKVSDFAIRTGHTINEFHEEEKYYLIKNRTEVTYY